MLKTWQLWLLYAMFVVIAAATLLPISVGGSRMLLGEASDQFDRTRMMAVSFLLAGLFRFGLIVTGIADAGVGFVVIVVGLMFFSSPLYVYFPANVAEFYGAKHSSSNYAVL